MLYLQFAGRFALWLEWSKEYSFKPLLRISPYKGETIIDIPYCRIIWTPGKVLDTENTKDEQRAGNFFRASERAIKN